MSLADQIAEMEDELSRYQEELSQYQEENSKLNDALVSAGNHIEDLEFDCEEMGKFIEYIDKTNPELRVAYKAANVLEGAKT